jgi:serine/threonine-protein kinase
MTELLDRLQRALADHYAIEREVGRGGMASVFLAEERHPQRQVAIKVLDPEIAAILGPERFLREVDLASNLTHPHILPIFSAGEAQGLLYYVMPYVEGDTLRDRLKREKQLPLDDALRVAREVADALSYAHSRDVIHRDIKPENILLASGHAVVADFGIARAISAAGGEQLTQTGMAVGTPSYMSPEQAAGSREIDGRSDLYSLGCVLYEMLAGQPPFTGPTVESVVQQHLASEAPAITRIRPAVPAEIAGVLARALAKTPADRFSPAAQFAEALRVPVATTAAQGTGAAAGPGTTSTAAPAPARWSRPARAAVGVVAAAAIIALTLWVPGRFRGGGSDAARSEKSVAVLPFENLSSDEGNAFFASGVHEEILTYLSKVSDLRVISRSSVMQYAGTRPSVQDVANDLGVAYVVEGSVQRAGDRVRVTAQLIDARSDEHVWAERFDRDLIDVFAIQSAVAGEIVRALEATLSPREEQLLAHRPTDNVEAYDLYLKARELIGRAGFTVDEDQRAVALLERAVALDPTFAEGHVFLATEIGAVIWWGQVSRSEGLPRMKAAIDRAFELEPDLAEARAALADYYYRGFFDYSRALEQLEIAREQLPNSSDILYRLGLTYRRLARWDESIQSFEESAMLDPANLTLPAEQLNTMMMVQRWSEARRLSDVLTAAHPDHAGFAGHRAHWFLHARGDVDSARAALAAAAPAPTFYYVESAFVAHLWARDYGAAVAVVDRYADVFDTFGAPAFSDVYAAEALLLQGDSASARTRLASAKARLEEAIAGPEGHDDAWSHMALGLALVLQGDHAGSRAACGRAKELRPESNDHVHGATIAAFCAYAAARAGEQETALDEIERLVDTPSGLSLWELRLDPRWEFLREHPRFEALVSRED